MRKGLIYKHTNKVNGKSYVGQTVYSMEKRWREHCSFANKNRTCYFYRAIVKHGKDAFEHEILEDNIPQDKLNEREIFYIEKYGTFDNGYNLDRGGQTRKDFRLTEETKRKLSEANKGKKLSKEQVDMMRENFKGIKGGRFKPWFFVDTMGYRHEFHSITKRDYALLFGIDESAFSGRFNQKYKDVIVPRGQYKGMIFGNIEDLKIGA